MKRVSHFSKIMLIVALALPFGGTMHGMVGEKLVGQEITPEQFSSTWKRDAKVFAAGFIAFPLVSWGAKKIFKKFRPQLQRIRNVFIGGVLGTLVGVVAGEKFLPSKIQGDKASIFCGTLGFSAGAWVGSRVPVEKNEDDKS